MPDETLSDLPLTVPVIPDHAYDFPPEPHVGHAAALNVPTSEGPASYVLDRGHLSERALIESESPIEPARQMEAGTDFDDETRARLAPLFIPLHIDPAAAIP